MAKQSISTFRRSCVFVSCVSLVFGLYLPSAQATLQSIRWDSEGFAEISAPPFTFSFELPDYSNPSEIDREGTVRVDLSAEIDVEVCAATIKATPLRDGIPVGDSAFLDATETFEFVAVWFPVISTPAKYEILIDASYETTSSTLCFSGMRVSTPFTTTIGLFEINKPLPGPPSTRPVTVTSSGPHTLVANTRGKSRPIPIIFTVKDPEKRSDLFQSICMGDVYDCWFEDSILKASSSTQRTATGWTRTWGFWWERASPSSCVNYYWNQPDVSVILLISNSDGKILGRKKHVVKLTCSR